MTMLGKKQSIETRKKISQAHLGKKLSKKTKLKISEAQKGEKSCNWKISNISKLTIHRRVEYKYGKPKYCEICKSTKKKRYEWSNKRHDYKMPINREDWQRVCNSCHIKYDYKYNNYKNKNGQKS